MNFARILTFSFYLLITGMVPALAQNDYLEQAKNKYETGDYKRCERDCAIYLETHPESEDVRLLQGKALLASGDFKSAISEFRRLPAKAGALELAMRNEDKISINDDSELGYPTWLQALVLHYLAKIQADRGNFDRALRLCDRAIDKTGIFPECLLLRINILVTLNRLYEAEELSRQLISQRPNDWHSWLASALVLEKQRKLPLSLQAFKLAQTLINTPPYKETDIDKRKELIQSKIDYLESKTGIRPR